VLCKRPGHFTLGQLVKIHKNGFVFCVKMNGSMLHNNNGARETWKKGVINLNYSAGVIRGVDLAKKTTT
jgi:hypothetical protein